MKVRLTVRVDSEVLQKNREIAREEGTTLSQKVTAHLTQLVREAKMQALASRDPKGS